MVNFERKMRESTTLFRDEQRVLDISQRLAEQTE
jgi:IEC3 subunit of the Ino80 complex, chromatin re-modelling